MNMKRYNNQKRGESQNKIKINALSFKSKLFNSMYKWLYKVSIYVSIQNLGYKTIANIKKENFCTQYAEIVHRMALNWQIIISVFSQNLISAEDITYTPPPPLRVNTNRGPGKHNEIFSDIK